MTIITVEKRLLALPTTAISDATGGIQMLHRRLNH